MLLSIDSIREHPQNARIIQPSLEADAALIESIRVIGLLQPILVVPDLSYEVNEAGPVAWELRAGARRLRAAKALGWTEIAAVELERGIGGTGAAEGGIDGEPPETAISAAENMVRAAMHPVDQWRALCDLRTSAAYSLETAAAALGVPLALARRMEWLGKMAQPVLDAIGQGDLPTTGFLRTIALAPHETQLIALERGSVGRGKIVDWRIVAEACTIKRIPRSRAIFDPDLMAWDEDLFGEADDEDRFTTSDVDTFLANQRTAMEARIAKSKGRMVAFTDEIGGYNVTLPKGWVLDHTPIPKRFAKDDPRKVFVCMSEAVHGLGEVDTYLARPARDTTRTAVDAHDRALPERPPITKKVMQQLAKLKPEAVRSKLLELKEHGTAAMLEALLLMFTFKNVQAGGIAGSPHGTLSSMVSAEGVAREDLSDEDLCDAAAWLISSAITFDAPDEFRASGKGAEWLAMTIGAEMPRTDTADILAGINGDTLRALAVQHGIKSSGTVSALRKRLVGALPDWRAATFGAPGPSEQPDRGPMTGADDDDDETDMTPYAGSDGPASIVWPEDGDDAAQGAVA